MPFLLVFFWLLHHFIVALTLLTSSPAVASKALTLSDTPLAKSATVPQNSLSNLTAIPPFDFRVPYSTIELHIACTSAVDANDLAWILLTMIEYIAEHLRRKGDGPLAPKEDPFGFNSPSKILGFTAQSVQGRFMTWGVLQTVAEGLYRSLTANDMDYAATFQIRDYEDNFQWGFGEILTIPPNTLIPTIVAVGNDTSSATVTDSTASDTVLAA